MTLLNHDELYKLVNQLSLDFFNKTFKHEVMFNKRLRTTGGRYLPHKKVIELNPKYLVELGLQELIGIIKHELCHYHLHIEGKGYKHGDQEFKSLLKETGSPRYCRPLPSNLKKYKYTYICQTCHYAYRRMRKVAVKQYRCGKCKGHIELQQ